MTTQKWIFIETWVDAGASTPIVMLLMCKNETSYEIYSPHEAYKVVFTTDNYQEATFWLAEDEFAKIGRLLYENVF